MATEKRKVVIKKCGKKYNPNIIYSHPFYFINLPLLGVLITIFYWLILGPLVYALVFKHQTTNQCCGSLIFWILALVLFIIILSILVCIWRCKPKREDELLYITQVEHNSMEVSNNIMLNDIIPSEVKTCEKEMKVDETDQEKIFPRCSLRQKDRRHPSPILIKREDERPVSQNLSSPLTPRELFFLDLIEASNKSCSSITHTFIEKERENYPSDMPLKFADVGKCASPSEFFIANVPTDTSCTSQVFVYVNATDPEPQFEITCENEYINIIEE